MSRENKTSRRVWTKKEIEVLKQYRQNIERAEDLAREVSHKIGRKVTAAAVTTVLRKLGLSGGVPRPTFVRGTRSATPPTPPPPREPLTIAGFVPRDEVSGFTGEVHYGPGPAAETFEEEPSTEPFNPLDDEMEPSGAELDPVPGFEPGTTIIYRDVEASTAAAVEAARRKIATAPPASPALPADDDSEEEVDPVVVREKRDKTLQLQRTVDDLVRRLKEANARQGFIEEAALHREPPRIYARERLSGVREMTAVALASDWHVEEPVYPESIAFRNEYNLEIAERRIERFFKAIIWNIEHHRASGRIAIRDLILWLGGDLYSGYIHDELVESNLLSPTEAIRWLLPRLRDGIATLLEHLGLDQLVIPCSHGNHGRTTHKPRISTGYANSFDWLLYHNLRDEFKYDGRVRFEITASGHQYVQVYDQTIHFHHGDDVKYQGGVGGLGIPLLKAVPMWDRVKLADVHCIGHWHQLRDYGRAVVNGSLIGFGPYSQRIRADFEAPQQAMFYMDSKRGKSMLTSLWVAEGDETPGLSMMGAAQ